MLRGVLLRRFEYTAAHAARLITSLIFMATCNANVQFALSLLSPPMLFALVAYQYQSLASCSDFCHLPDHSTSGLVSPNRILMISDDIDSMPSLHCTTCNFTSMPASGFTDLSGPARMRSATAALCSGKATGPSSFWRLALCQFDPQDFGSATSKPHRPIARRNLIKICSAELWLGSHACAR